ncbi:uncharacterized protein L203_102161 [Cryptococcus depauperatus CBS 7841]|uniref:Uncharacterized protein n=1 Tax=Cryptococcus depauperatus CBS 7841 TaxID=1295531 RepID=A0AAJ8M0V0_9TREE
MALPRAISLHRQLPLKHVNGAGSQNLTPQLFQQSARTYHSTQRPILTGITTALVKFLHPCHFYSIGCRFNDGYKTASAYLKERGCPTLRTPSGIRSKVNGKALPFKSLHCDSSFLVDTPSFGLGQGQRLERWD